MARDVLIAVACLAAGTVVCLVLGLLVTSSAYAVTRFHFPVGNATTPHQTPAVAPTPAAGWTVTTAMQRYALWLTTDDALGKGQFVPIPASTANYSALDRQYVTTAIAAGTAFTTATTISIQLSMREENATDDVMQCITAVVIWDSTATTIRATLRATTGSGTDRELVNNANTRSQTCSNAVVSTANYTTVTGDILVVEIG